MSEGPEPPEGAVAAGQAGGGEPAAGGFEPGLKRLEEVVRRLEGGDLPLEESLRLFEEGTRLARELNGTLERAERTIELLLSQDDGPPTTTPFEPEDED